MKECRGKIIYTKREAETLLNALQHYRNTKDRAPKRIYECPICNFWHMTSQEEYIKSEKIPLILIDKWKEVMNKQELE